MATDLLAVAAELLTLTRLQLEREGYPRGLVAAGLERARGTAIAKARPISASIYDQAVLDLLRDELQTVRDWMDRQRRAVEATHLDEP